MLNADQDAIGQKKRAVLEQELANHAWHVGRNLEIDYRWGITLPEPAQRALAELPALKPDVLLANSVVATMAAKEATQQVPIVFTAISEPIGLGIVASLSHPGANVTGFTNFEPSVGAKWLELIKGVAPGLEQVAFLFNPDSTPATELFYEAINSASAKFSVDVLKLSVHTSADIDSGLMKLGQRANVGLIVQPDTFLSHHALQIVDLAARYHLPAIYPFDFFTTDGGLLIDRILRGEKPSDLPVQEPTTFRLVINRNTAKTAGFQIPDKLLALADEVID